MHEHGSDSSVLARQSKLLITLERLLAIQATTMKPALDAASNLVAEAINADKVDAFLVDRTVNTLVAVGTSTTPMGRLQKELGLDRLALANGGRVVEVFETGRPYSSGAVDADEGELIGIRESLGVRSQIAVALEISGERQGVLAVASGRRGAFSDEDLGFLQAVAQWVGMTAQRADLVERMTREAAKEARQLTAEQLITVLAHDIGNYLTPLVGRIYMLRMRAERDGRALDLRDLETSSRTLERLSRLITDLLDVGRIEQGLFVLARQPVDLVALAHETVDLMNMPDAQIQVSTPDTLDANVDPDRVRQALQNLLSNALKHSPSGTPVQLRLTQQQRDDALWAVLSVEDRGSGISPTLLPQIFDRFVSGTTSKGLGLGLYLVHRVASAHGGSLTVDSTLGVGTRFDLLLPLTP